MHRAGNVTFCMLVAVGPFLSCIVSEVQSGTEQGIVVARCPLRVDRYLKQVRTLSLNVHL